MYLGHISGMNTARPHLIDCRLATTRDAHQLARMSRDYVERGHGWNWQAPRIQRCINSPESVVLCACTQSSDRLNQETIAGFAIMDFGEHRAHLSLLAVTPRKRRHGIAQTLLSWLEKTAVVAGIAEITLEVRAQNVGARRFYKALNFDEFEQVPRYYSGRENAYRLRKVLREPFND